MHDTIREHIQAMIKGDNNNGVGGWNQPCPYDPYDGHYHHLWLRHHPSIRFRMRDFEG